MASSRGYSSLWKSSAGKSRKCLPREQKEIVVSSRLARDMQVKTLLREIAHAVSDPCGMSTDTDAEEVVAEGAAYLAAAQLGLDTSTYSLGYVAGWGRDLKKILAAGDRMMAVAGKILERLESVESPALVAV